MNFGQAIEALKWGERVARAGWNGEGMWLTLIQEATHTHRGQVFQRQPYIAMKTVQGTLVPWLASQTDVLAEDWVKSEGIVPSEKK